MMRLSPAPEDDDLPAHSLLGASGAHRWLHCPGSFTLARRAPTRPASIYAATGTLAHSYIEEAIGEGTYGAKVSDQNIGRQHQVDQHLITVDQTFIDGVNVMLEYVWQNEPRYRLFAAELTVRLDSYFKALGIQPPVRLYGRADLIMLAPEQHLMEVVDYKNGSGIQVDPKDNPQILYYAAGALAELAVNFPDITINQIKLTVVQPNGSGDKIKSWNVDVLDVLMWVDSVLIPGVQACTEPDAPLNPEPSICRFCPVSFTCPALIDRANQMAKQDFKDAMLPSDMVELAAQLDLAACAEVWIDAMRGYAVEQLKQQIAIPGWGLAPTRPHRIWKDKAALERIVKILGIERDVYTHEVFSPAQMEKVAKRKGLSWDKQFAPLVDRVSSGVKLQRTDASSVSEFPEC